MAETLLVLAFTALLLHGAAKVLSRLEKAFRCRNLLQPIHVQLPHSLQVLKITRSTLFFSGAAEVAFLRSWSFTSVAFGFSLLAFGMALRVLAIRELGPLWSYRIGLKPGHRVVTTGIYRWMRHPAYLGNIHIVGLLLMVGAPLTGAAAFVLTLTFYIVRGRCESRLLRSVEVQAHV